MPNLPEAMDDDIDGSSLTLPGDMLNIDPLIDNGNGPDTFGGDGPGTTPILLIDPVSGNPVSSITTFSGGLVTVNDGNTPNDPTDDTFDYTAANTGNTVFTESFEYQICDSDGPPECDTATVTFSVQTPVALSAFSSERTGDSIKVDWSTSSELFNVGSLKPIAWDHIRKQADAQMAARGYAKDRVHGYRKVRASSAADSPSVVEFKVGASGMYLITAGALLTAGMDWRDVARRECALSG